MNKVRTCLWYESGGHEAAELYVSLLPDSRIEGSYVPDPAAPPLTTDFLLAGVPYQALSAGPMFPQTEAASISVLTDDQAETDRLWEALTADGGRESQCGWLKDRWGVSWQIVPREVLSLMTMGGDSGQRAFQAVMGMVKLDIAAVRAAAEGA